MKAKAPRPLKVLVLVQKGLVPPDEATQEEVLAAPWKMEYGIIRTLKALGHTPIALAVEGNLGVIREAVDAEKPNIAFNCLEGFDEVSTWDTNIVGYLEMLKLPYTGCNSRGLMLGREKSLSKMLLSYHRIPVPRFVIVPRGRKVKRPKRLAFPLFVKSLTMDSSIGISQASVVESDQKLEERVKFIHESIGTDALVEQYIEGRELYVGVLGNQRLNAFPIWELSFAKMPLESQKIATERLKWSLAYQRKHGIESGAAELEPDVAEKIQTLCKRSYRILMMSGYARIDLRLSAEGRAYVIEANPNPQLSKDEDFAQSALAAGVRYPELIQKVLNLGLSWDTTA